VVALRRGDAGRAESLLTTVHQDATAPASVRLRAGIHHLDVLLDARRGHPALSLAEELARAHADEPAVLNRLGLARLSVGDLDGATAALRRAAERAPEDPSPRINLAEVARQRGDLPVARAHLERAIALREGDGEAWLAYGIVLAAQGGAHRVAARTAILRAARLLPDNAGPWVAQGNLDLEESRWTEAATSFREALQRDAHQVTARTNLGVALARAGDRRGALVAFTEATQRAPNAGEAWNGLGAMHLAAVELITAVDPMQRAMVPTGVRVAIPEGYEAQIRPRSGLAIKYGISMVNTPGTIDADYRGELKVLLINFGESVVTLLEGDRIGQLVLSPVSRIVWTEVSELPSTERGAGGFGSTGT
jgi:dUTP pyrophosphatase